MADYLTEGVLFDVPVSSLAGSPIYFSPTLKLLGAERRNEHARGDQRRCESESH